MGRHDWYRNTTWSEDAARAFEEKLRRARDTQQYLLIQASTLATTRPAVALDLLARYFDLPGEFHHALAHVARACAYLALGQVSDSVVSYEAALAREAEFPGLLTTACLDFPYVVATRRRRELYPRALELLNRHMSRVLLPVEHFQWHAAQALIAKDCGRAADAKAHATQAMEAATETHSGFRYHPSVGLVSEAHGGVLETLSALANS